MNRVRCRHREQESPRHAAAVLVETRRGDERIETRRRQLPEEDAVPRREIVCRDAVDLRNPVGVARIEPVRRVGADLRADGRAVTPVITPACRLRDDGGIDGVRTRQPAGHHFVRGQRAAIEHVFLGAVREGQLVLRAQQEIGVQVGGQVGARDAVVGVVLDHPLRIPQDILKTSGRRAVAHRVPVAVTTPVLIRSVEFEQHVVDERRHIQIGEHLVVLIRVLQIAQSNHLVVREQITVDGLRRLRGDGVILLLLAAEISCGEIRVRLLGEFVETPIQAVQVEMEMACVSCQSAHRAESVLRPSIANA